MLRAFSVSARARSAVQGGTVFRLHAARVARRGYSGDGGQSAKDIGSTAGVATDDAAGSELSPVTFARSLVRYRRSGTLTTAAAAPPDDGQSPLFGTPMMPYISVGPSVVVALREDEQHVKNLEFSPLASMMISALTPQHTNPAQFKLPSVTLAGPLQPIGAVPEAAPSDGQMREMFKEVHPGVLPYLDEFSFFLLDPSHVNLFTGDESIPLDKAEYDAAELDVVAREIAPVIREMNEVHRPMLAVLCLEYASQKAEQCFVYHIDSLGFNVMARSTEGGSDKDGAQQETWLRFRFPFPQRMHTAELCRRAILEGMEHAQASQDGQYFNRG